MSWLSEISRGLSGPALLRHVENRLYRNCEGQPRRPARADPHWTRRARALINQAGLSHRLQQIPAPETHLSANASGRGENKGQPAGAKSPVTSASGGPGHLLSARMVGNREGAGGDAHASPPASPGWTDDPEFWAPLMGADEATPGEASHLRPLSLSNAASAN